MKNFVNRIKSRILAIKKAYITDLHFSRRLANYRMLEEICQKMRLSKISLKYHEKKDEWILQYLIDSLNPILEQYKSDNYLGEKNENSPIWVCWWTGLETAPALVEQCIASIYDNAGTHQVHLITQDNYSEYITIPEYITQRITDGQMGLAHLADYIRVKLLATYGGLWLDATIFCSQKIPELCFELPVFTLKGPVRKSMYISDYRWVTFCLGGWKGNLFYRFLVDAFETYWRNNLYAIDYLFFDYIIYTVYNMLPEVRKQFDSIPDNNIRRDDLQAAMNAALPAEQFKKIIKVDTSLYKLSWREKYSLKTFDGKQSIYHYFLYNL